MIADFAARVAKAATEESDSGSPASASTPETPTSQNPPQTLTNIKIPMNPDIDNNSQCNTGPPTPTQSIPCIQSLSNQSLVSSNNALQPELCSIKPKEHKPLQLPVKEFQPRNEIKILPEEPQPIPVVINQEIISPQLTIPVVTPSVPEPETPVASVPPPSIPRVASIPVPVSIPVTISNPSPAAVEVTAKPIVAPNSNPVPFKEEFPTLESKVSSNSPARRKSHNQGQSQAAVNAASDAPSALPKEPKERKLSERNLNSRGTTPTPVQNQADHHNPKPNGDMIGEKIDKHDPEPISKNDHQQHQRLVDGKCLHHFFSHHRIKNI